MPELSPDDARWFAGTGETHRIRPATSQEAVSFKVRRIGFSKLLTVVRRRDGAKVTHGFQADIDIDRAMDCELAGWFGPDLDVNLLDR